MQCVGRNSHGAGATNNMALKSQQAKRGNNGKYHNGDAQLVSIHRLRVNKATCPLQQQKTGRTGDKCRLTQPGQRLRLAVAKTVFPVCR